MRVLTKQGRCARLDQMEKSGVKSHRPKLWCSRVKNKWRVTNKHRVWKMSSN